MLVAVSPTLRKDPAKGYYPFDRDNHSDFCPFAILHACQEALADHRCVLDKLVNLQNHFPPTEQVGVAGSRDVIGRGHVKIAPEVHQALSNGHAVVALESTIISHGMPYPQNLETAKEVEAIVKANGAVPATIAVLDGVPCIALDISSDLTELGRTPVAVISAGIKSILDIPRTLEYLETQGVPVVAYKSQEFPAFFTESSGFKVPCCLDSPEECAQLIDSSTRLGLGTGILIGVPIPKEHAASGSLIESAIQRALKEASIVVLRDNNVTGNAETPFLLARVNELTGGASLTATYATWLTSGLHHKEVTAVAQRLCKL
ncbi:hypothetical protein ACLOJK_009638 [Asimina triloba]